MHCMKSRLGHDIIKHWLFVNDILEGLHLKKKNMEGIELDQEIR